MVGKLAHGDLWPSRLGDLKSQTPDELWYEGDISLLHNTLVGVVGSRRITHYGRQVTARLVRELVEADQVVVSGFMYGVDQEAHRKVIEYGGRTIAVLGYGIEYPGERDKELRTCIVQKGGLILSEWRDRRPERWTFPARNRIVAALSHRIYVVEAAAKSGALITADWALKLHRELYAIPGPITSSVSVGTNELISGGWAKPWTGGRSDNTCSSNNTDLYIILQNELLTLDEISEKLEKDISEVTALVMQEIMAGRVKEFEGRYSWNNDK